MNCIAIRLDSHNWMCKLPVAGVGVLETEISTDDDVIGGIFDISSLVDVVNTLVEVIVASVLEVGEILVSPDASIL